MTDIRERTDMVGTQPVVGTPHPAVLHDAGTPAEEIVTPKLGVLFWICVSWLSANVLLVMLAGVLPIPDPNQDNFNAVNAGPGAGHILGTDDLGRDILSRIIFGGRVSLTIAFGAILVGMLLGGTLGMIAGYLRGNWETAMNAVALMLLAFPPLVAIMAVSAFWVHPSDNVSTVTGKIMLAIGILASPLLFRVIYASTISYSTREFVTAARGLGATSYRVIFRELLPNVLPAIVSFALIGVATVIILEGALAFLGLSVEPPTPSWGNMINEGRSYLSQNLWLTLWPVITIVLFLLALNFISDKLRQRFDISEGRL
jgi:peptide/nickel transport system permease protein